jgi:hypothetical protein
MALNPLLGQRRPLRDECEDKCGQNTRTCDALGVLVTNGSARRRMVHVAAPLEQMNNITRSTQPFDLVVRRLAQGPAPRVQEPNAIKRRAIRG